MVPRGSQPQIFQIQPLDFSPLGALFKRYLTVKYWRTPPSSAYFVHSPLLKKWSETGVIFWKLLRCNVTRGLKWRCFRKHLASLHQKIRKWPKTGGSFEKLLQKQIVVSTKMHFFLITLSFKYIVLGKGAANPPPPPPPRPKCPIWTLITTLFYDRMAILREMLPKKGIIKPQGLPPTYPPI